MTRAAQWRATSWAAFGAAAIPAYQVWTGAGSGAALATTILALAGIGAMVKAEQ